MGAAELIGAAALLVPGTAFYAASALSLIMMGAMGTLSCIKAQ